MIYFSPVWAFIRRLNLSQIALVGVIGLALFWRVELGIERRHSAKSDARVNELVALREADRAAYEKAAAEAKAKNLDDVRRIERESQERTDEVKAAYDRDLARLRNGGLREGIATPQGNAGCPGPSADGKAAGKPDAEIVCVPRSLLVRAAEIELARNALIDWVNAQLGVKR